MPWRELPKKTRDWILFTEEQPRVPVYAGFDLEEARQALRRKEEPSYMGTFTGARRHVLHTFATTQSALMKRRVAQLHDRHRRARCARASGCGAKRLSVKFAAIDIATMGRAAA